MEFQVVNSPNQALAYTNNAFIKSKPSDCDYVLVQHSPTGSLRSQQLAFRLLEHHSMEEGSLGLNSLNRRDLGISESMVTTGDAKVTLIPIKAEVGIFETHDIIVEITAVLSGPKPYHFIESELIKELAEHLSHGQILDPQRIYLFHLPATAHLLAGKIVSKTLEGSLEKGILGSVLGVDVNSRQPIEIQRDTANFFRDFSVNDLGIGGLDEEINYIFRRVFVTRLYSQPTLEKLGITHIRGMLLYGPPGTGKTLIARRLSQMLKCTSLKVVNGPEILDKYVGESEKRLRELFAEAEAANGSGLHVIVFDEIDSLCRSRGSNSGTGGTGVSDNIVNQLLTKMDGVEALNNILIIGMTNRIDLIDSALLRPGRFEVKVKISLPDSEGRKKIFHIHTHQMTQHSYSTELDYDLLARETANFTGAEISGVVRNATSHALSRDVDQESMTSRGTEIQVTMEDFRQAIKEAKPMFAKRISFDPDLSTEIEPNNYRVRSNIYFVGGPATRSFASDPHNLLATNDSDPEMVAKRLAQKLDFPNVVMISNYDLIALDGYRKSERIKSQVAESLVAEKSLVIFNRVEEIIDFFPFNQHFNVNVAGTIKTLLNYQYKEEVAFIVVSRESNDEIRAILDLN